MVKNVAHKNAPFGLMSTLKIIFYLKEKANFIGKGAFKLFNDFVVSCRCVYVNKRAFSDYISRCYGTQLPCN